MKSLVDSGNFKLPDHKLKTKGANMPFAKAVLLMSARLPRRTVYALKTSSRRPCRPRAKLGGRGAHKIRLCYGAWGGSFYFADKFQFFKRFSLAQLRCVKACTIVTAPTPCVITFVNNFANSSQLHSGLYCSKRESRYTYIYMLESYL